MSPFSKKPGITGWAQFKHKNGETIEDTVVKLGYDMYYIKKISPALDLHIVLHTLKAMLRGNWGINHFRVRRSTVSRIVRFANRS